MLSDSIPTVEVAQSRLEALQAKAKAAELDVQWGVSTEGESAILLGSRKADRAKISADIADMKARAIAIDIKTIDLEILASQLTIAEKQAELMDAGIKSTTAEYNADLVQTAEARIEKAKADAEVADADVILQQALLWRRFAEFSESVGHGVGCTGLSGDVQRAMGASIAAAKELATQKDNLASLKELNSYVTV